MSTIIVLLASLVTTITALSMSAICSNGIVKGGGAYYLISRSLGPQFGGSIGIIFCIANIVGAAMYVVGFAEVTRDVLKDHGFSLIDGDVNDVRFIGLAVTLILLAVVFIGLGFEAKMQVILLGIVGITILN
uniref:Amino acid permease/ SLC12A domain-containing protein n=1 Tax=Panagrolaimus sp. JU765 TaxID=591449 RepID=A0AC34QZH1_9BILA